MGGESECGGMGVGVGVRVSVGGESEWCVNLDVVSHSGRDITPYEPSNICFFTVIELTQADPHKVLLNDFAPWIYARAHTHTHTHTRTRTPPPGPT